MSNRSKCFEFFGSQCSQNPIPTQRQQSATASTKLFRYIKQRYFLQAAIADSEFFLVCRLINVFSVDEDGDAEAGMAYEGLPAFTEKLMGAFIRQ